MSEITKAEIRQRLGNITQLQELLFGEQIKEYEHKLEQYEQRINQLEFNHQEFKTAIEKQIKELENKLISQIDSTTTAWEKKIQYFYNAAQREQSKTKQELNTLTQHSYRNTDLLQDSMNAYNNSLKSEIIQSKSEIEQTLRLFKQQILEKLELDLFKLSSAKVSRSDLAEVLFDICVQLKETEASSKIIEGKENKQLEEASETSVQDRVILETN